MSILRRINKIILICILICSFAGQYVTLYAAEAEEYQPTAFAMVDITELDIAGLQQAVDDGYLTYEQIMMLYLDRIYAYSDMYECLIYISDTAIEEARNCDRIYRENGRTSDIFGLPVIVKDNIDVEGMPTTNGNKYLESDIASEDAPIIANLKESGAIIVAKANMDRYAEHAQYSISDYGRVNNAYDLTKSSYGSSGGSAVSSAAALAPICIGTDTNASIRVPSAVNGVVGIRPTKGLLSTEGVTPLIQDRDTAGPIAKTVTDSAIILSAMTDYENDYTKYLDEYALDGMRIGVIDNLANRSVGAVDVLFEEALSVLEECGAELIHMNISLATSYNCSVAVYNTIFTAAMDRYDVDIVVYPTMYGEAYSHSAAVGGSNSNGWYIAPSAGVPAITVPMGTDSSGIPTGIEFAGRAYDDGIVISAAYCYEQSSDIHVKTELAPNLYEAVDELETLYEIKNNGIYPNVYGYEAEEAYGYIEEAYQSIEEYLDSRYYICDDVAERASELYEAYELAIIKYDAVCWQFMNEENSEIVTRMVMYSIIRDMSYNLGVSD